MDTLNTTVVAAAANLAVFFDTETTGLPLWKEPSESEGQPHIVQLAACVVDLDTRKTIMSMDLIVKPNGWIIPPETVEVHGITTERALAVGLPEDVVIGMFLDMASAAGKRIAYNEQFDARIMRIGLKRYFDDDIAEAFKAAPTGCAMRRASAICKLGKFPKLAEAHEIITGQPLVNAHSAMADTQGAIAVWFGVDDVEAKQEAQAA